MVRPDRGALTQCLNTREICYFKFTRNQYAGVEYLCFCVKVQVSEELT